MSGKGLFRKVQEIITYFFVTCDDKASVSAAKPMMYEEGQRSANVFLEVRGGGSIITNTQKQRNSVAANTAPVTIVPRKVSQEPVFLARSMRRQSIA